MLSSATAQDVFQELRFRESVQKAMESVQQILETTRNPRLPEDEDHVYDDKYALTEVLTNMVVAAEMNTLQALFNLGEDDDNAGDATARTDLFDQLWKTVNKDERSVTLRFEAQETTQFIKKVEDKVVTHERDVEEIEITEDGEETSSMWGSWGSQDKTQTKTTKTKISETIVLHHWKVGWQWRLVLFFGTDTESAITVVHRNSSRTFVSSKGTTSRSLYKDDRSPLERTTIFDPIDINLTWLLQTISQDNVSQFTIHRQDPQTCKTPRRNRDVEAAIEFLWTIQIWGDRVVSFFHNEMPNIEAYTTAQSNKYRDFLERNRQLAQTLFLPTLPLLENSTVLSDLDLGKLLEEQATGLEKANTKLRATLPEDDPRTLVSAVEAQLLVVSYHVQALVD